MSRDLKDLSLLTSYVLGELNDEEKQEVRLLIEKDDDLKLAMMELLKTSEVLKQHLKNEAPVQLSGAERARVEEGWHKQERQEARRRLIKRSIGVASALTAATIVFIMVLPEFESYQRKIAPAGSELADSQPARPAEYALNRHTDRAQTERQLEPTAQSAGSGAAIEPAETVIPRVAATGGRVDSKSSRTISGPSPVKEMSQSVRSKSKEPSKTSLLSPFANSGAKVAAESAGQVKGRSVRYYGAGSLKERSRAVVTVGGEGESYKGSIDKEGVRRVLRQNQREIQACYEKALNQKPELTGTVVLEWEIRAKGRPDRVRVLSTSLNDTLTEKCVMNILRLWTFPAPPPGEIAVVTFPFVFMSQQ